MKEEWDEPFPEPLELPIEGVLDLHTFNPGEARSLVPEYLRACVVKGIREVDIIHGKGSGTLRRIVHAALEKDDLVEGYRWDGTNWGVTRVTLKEPDVPSENNPS